MICSRLLVKGHCFSILFSTKNGIFTSGTECKFVTGTLPFPAASSLKTADTCNQNISSNHCVVRREELKKTRLVVFSLQVLSDLQPSSCERTLVFNTFFNQKWRIYIRH